MVRVCVSRPYLPQYGSNLQPLSDNAQPQPGPSHEGHRIRDDGKAIRGVTVLQRYHEANLPTPSAPPAQEISTPPKMQADERGAGGGR